MESPKTLEGANYQNNVAECCGTCELTGRNDMDYYQVYCKKFREWVGKFGKCDCYQID